MEVACLNNSEFGKWDEFIKNSPQYSIYLNSWYLQALAKPFEIFVALNEGKEIQGGIVLAQNEIKSYSNPLLCKYLGICFKNFDGNEYLLESKRREVSEILMPTLLKYKTFDYTFHPSFDNWLNFYWQQFKMKVNYTYLIDLKKGYDHILENYHGKLRSEIKFAEKEQLVFRQGIDFDIFYETIKMSFSRQGGPTPFGKDFLKNWYSQLQSHNCVDLFGVFKGEKCLAVAGLLYDEHSANLLFNGINHNAITRGANEYLIAETIRHYSTIATHYDFEGSMLKPVESFYRKFGGKRTTYYNIWADNLVNNTKRTAIKFSKKILYGK